MRRFPRLSQATFALVLVLGLPLVTGAQVAEVEPNNTLPQADAAPHFTGDVVISGGISPVADTDIFRLDLDDAAVLRVETFDFSGAGCAPGIASTLRLLTFAGGSMYVDAGSGILGCAALVVALEAGTYYVSVEETGNDASIPGYKLQLKVQASIGSESEPNGTRVEANWLVGSDVYLVGDHQNGGESDFFAITVPDGAAIRAEVIEGDTSETCESDGIDSDLLIYDANGTFLGSGDNDGRGRCSLIDGTDGSRVLPAGTYYLELRAGSDILTLDQAMFDYRLVVRVVTPDLIFEDDFEGGPTAQVVINEFNANVTSPPSCDLIELRVVAGGSMNGYSLRERDVFHLVAFSGLMVATNDLVVVHLRGNDPLCNPGGVLNNETVSPTQIPSATHATNYDTAYDWYSADTGLTNTDNVFTLYDDRGQIMDAVLTADDPTGTAALGSENQAAVVAAAGEWTTTDGSVPPGGFVDDNFCAHAVLDLNATGTTATGTSIQRTTNVDSNDKDGWTTGAGAPQTWGLPNSGQTPY